MAKIPAKKPATPKSELYVSPYEQGSAEWFKARAGLPTASHFSTILASGRDGETSLTRAGYLNRLAAEIITGEPIEETFASKAMERGKLMEADACADYVERTGRELKRVGLGINFSGLKRCGASPDALVGFDGGLETKTMRPDLMIPLLLKGSMMMPEHRAQVQGNMLVFERDWWDLKIYWRNMPDFTVRVMRDEIYIKELWTAIEVFNHDLKRLVEQLRKMGAA